MRATHKYSSHSDDWTNSRFVPLKGCRPVYDGSRDYRARHLDKNSVGEPEDTFRDQTSEPARTMRADIERVARRPHNIFITGETGTGKTHAAREIHRRSQRANEPFMELNCANLPEQLVEAELFGYRKGAFTGADHDHMGLFEEANGGTLFLDEIGDVPLTVQNRLLKAIDEKKIKRLGTNHYTFCDVQIIAATSRNLPRMIHKGEFREDLYCRLAVLTVETTPLRERREDIPAIIALFLREAAGAIPRSANQNESYRIEEGALALLCQFDYPGNIRTLRNLIYEITSHVDENEAISTQLVQLALAKVNYRVRDHLSVTNDYQSPDDTDAGGYATSSGDVGNMRSTAISTFLSSIASEGDIILPVELCVLRRGETFKQWTARARRCSIEAAHQATGGMQSAAERLGLTRQSLKAHLRRAKRAQDESLFDLQNRSQ